MIEILIGLNLVIAISCILLLGTSNVISISLKSKLLVFVITNIPFVNIFLLAFLLLN